MPTNKDNPLCSSCEKIEKDFEAIFTRSESGLKLEERITLSISPGCVFCDILKCLLQADSRRFPTRWEPYKEHPPNAFQIWAAPFIDHASINAIGIVLSVDTGIKLFKKVPRIDHHSHQGFLLPTSPVNDQSLVLGQVINRQQVDCSVIQRWIEECQLHHTHQACRQAQKAIPDLQVIDCASGKIIPYPDGSPYLALSYVWGQQSRYSKATRALKTGLGLRYFPRTVRDAMHVTRSLGYRFLWVDQYCIDQRDKVRKAQQIAMMDKIYEGAKVTIVAAFGLGDESGLAGAGPSSPQRDVQPKVRIGDHELVWSLPALPYVIKETKWATRGWTYQEALLSTRCLIFTKSQVFLSCKSTTRFETIPYIPQDSLMAARTCKNGPYEATIDNIFDDGMFDGDGFKMEPTTFCQELQRHASTYLMRSLTYETDTVNAFMGILTRSECTSLWGIPLIYGKGCREGDKDEPGRTSTILSAFIRGLAWVGRKSSKYTRRSTVPSWSWLSLQKSHIWFKQDPDLYIKKPPRRLVTRSPDVDIWCRNETNTGWQWFSTLASPTSGVIPISSPDLLIQTRVGWVSRLIKQTEFGTNDLYYTVHVDELGPNHPGFSMTLDCLSSLNITESEKEETWHDLEWRLTFLNLSGYWTWPGGTEYPEGEGPDMYLMDKLESAYFLVLEKAPGNKWRRVGLALGEIENYDLKKLPLEHVIVI